VRGADSAVRAAWRDNIEIDEPATLISVRRSASRRQLTSQVLSAAGFDGKGLVAAASTGDRADAARKTLRANVDEAAKLGLNGVPSFQLGKHIVWGQDRLPVVQDLLAGWRSDTSTLVAKVGGLRYHDCASVAP